MNQKPKNIVLGAGMYAALTAGYLLDQYLPLGGNARQPAPITQTYQQPAQTEAQIPRADGNLENRVYSAPVQTQAYNAPAYHPVMKADLISSIIGGIIGAIGGLVDQFVQIFTKQIGPITRNLVGGVPRNMYWGLRDFADVVKQDPGLERFSVFIKNYTDPESRDWIYRDGVRHDVDSILGGGKRVKYRQMLKKTTRTIPNEKDRFGNDLTIDVLESIVVADIENGLSAYDLRDKINAEMEKTNKWRR